MAEEAAAADPKSGFCAETKTFRSLRPSVPLPPDSLPLSFAAYALSHLSTRLPANPALVDSSKSSSLSYADLVHGVRSLSYSLKSQFHLSRADVAFVLSPNRIEVPVLYLALLSLGVVVCPANPVSTPAEISRLCDLVGPISLAFAISSTVSKLPPLLAQNAVLLDTVQFRSLSSFAAPDTDIGGAEPVRQTDAAAI